MCAVLLPPGVNQMCAVLLPPGVNQMCAVLLPPGVNPIAVKYTYHMSLSVFYNKKYFRQKVQRK
jgi:hypothetical protein